MLYYKTLSELASGNTNDDNNQVISRDSYAPSSTGLLVWVCDKILQILNSHPELAIEKKLTNESKLEQSSANLNECSEEEFEEFKKLNLEYKTKFGFPFIIAVKGKNKNEILVNFRERIQNDLNKEFLEAKNQVKKIASFRLKDILSF